MDKDIHDPYFADLRIDFFVTTAIMISYVIPAIIITINFKQDAIIKFNIVIYSISTVIACVICSVLYIYNQENELVLLVLRCFSQFNNYLIEVSEYLFIFEMWKAYITLTSFDYKHKVISNDRVKVCKIIVVLFQLLITLAICAFLVLRYYESYESSKDTLIREIIF